MAKEQVKEGMEKINDLIAKVKPHLEKVEPVLRALVPYCVIVKEKSVKAYYVLQPLYDEEVGHVALGVVLLFFGGHFAMTIACWQVFRLSGQAMLSKSWRELADGFKEAYTTLNKDSEASKLFEHEKDGSISIYSVASGLKDLALAENDKDKSIARTKVLLLLKCVDPNKIFDAFGGLFTGCLAILAALRSRFVQCITMGANIGKKMVDIVNPLIQPKLYEAYPNHKKWIDFVLRSSGTIVGGIVSLLLIRVISAFNSALEGAHMLVEKFISISKRKGYFEQYMSGWEPTPEQSRIMIGALTFVGFMSQARTGFSLPMLLRLLLSPFVTVEYLLTLLAARPY